jgi:ferrous iron transport protein A
VVLLEAIDLTKLVNNREVKVVAINGGRHFQEKVEAMGLRLGVKIKKLSSQVLNGPVTIKIGHTKVALGHGMAKKIMVDNKNR